MSDTNYLVVVVGGGYSGAAAAIQLLRRAEAPLSIAMVEPRPELGGGLAYSATDPDWRLNGNVGSHVVDAADPGALTRWCEATGLLERDPGAKAPNGNLYIRRSEFGRFVRESLKEAVAARTGASLRHVRDTAIGFEERDGLAVVRTAGGEALAAPLVVVATGNGRTRLPPAFEAALANDPRVIVEPLADPRLREIPGDARVLVVGAGLTALDVLSTLVRRDHRGGIVALSRRGLRPVRHAPPSPDPDASAKLMARIVAGELPPFAKGLRKAPTARELLRTLRAGIRAAEREGLSWHMPFDTLRDVVWRFWPDVPAAEKRRFLRHLRIWYDTHRFRAPPQNDAMVRAAEAAGAIAFRAGRLVRVAAHGEAVQAAWQPRDEPAATSTVTESFDVVVNCAGLDAACGARDNPFLASLVARGLLTPDPTGVGFAVDPECRPIGAHGAAHEALRIVGPPTAGAFGDPLGTLFIAPQLGRILPGMLAALARGAVACR